MADTAGRVDDRDRVRAVDGLDTLGLVEATLGLPEQVAWARDHMPDVSEVVRASAVRSIVVLGMGGSGIVGDVAFAIASPSCTAPILVVKDYELPAFVDESTLVFAVSFSGNTEETVTTASAARDRGAQIVAVSAGGRLAELAAAWAMPHIDVPSQLPMPRVAIGAQSVPVLLALDQLGLVSGVRDEVEAMHSQLVRRREELRQPAMGGAVALARKIGATFPLIYGGGALGAVAASRWKADFNENAKIPAFANRHPELCHNELAGWGQHGDVTRQVLTLVELRHSYEHPQVAKRFAVAGELTQEVVADVLTVEAEGTSPLAQLFDLMIIGDCVSIELALQRGVDPGPIDALEITKRRVAAHSRP